MMQGKQTLLVCGGCLALSACGNPGTGAPGAVSEGEAKALEEAAEMLEERRLPEGALPTIDLPADAQATLEPDQESNSE